MTQPQHSVQLKLTTLADQQCTVSFEPKGAQALLPVGEVFTVGISGPGDGIVEVSFAKDGLIIGEWDGAYTRARNRRGADVATF
jgi:hypothetical protein